MYKGRLSTTIILMVLVASCVPVEKLSYFNDFDEIQEPITNPREQKIIMPFDKLYIRVLSIDEQTSNIFNSSDQMRMGGNNASGIIGYLVDENGNINFPFVGDINVGDMTTSKAAEKIENSLNDYVSNTSVEVKYIDNQVTVLGEVQTQGVHPFIHDKLNIYEALALGGGITRYGNRKNVVLIRQEGEKIMHYRLNLSDSKVASKDNYFILPNDVIVVEPLKAISSSYANITYTTILTTITTLIAILLFVDTYN